MSYFIWGIAISMIESGFYNYYNNQGFNILGNCHCEGAFGRSLPDATEAISNHQVISRLREIA